MTQYFAVKNYKKFQHYKDRNPPWIKLYSRLLADHTFACLPDASKLHLILLWVLASQHDNRIPYDQKWVTRAIQTDGKVNLEALKDAGFIYLISDVAGGSQDASALPATCAVSVPSENREQRTDKDKGAVAPFVKFWEAYPLKKAKGTAERAWKKLKPDEALLNTMLTAIQQQTAERKAAAIRKEFVPEWKHPATWLNARCWEDSVSLTSTKPATAGAAHDDAEAKRRRETLDIARYEQRRNKLAPQGSTESDVDFIARINRDSLGVAA